jgi:NAD-dependent dihydropyrimidine dehydrogenase PreA subunit
MLREKFPWFPSIEYSTCLADLECLNFCPHEVFEWDPTTGRPMVAHPYRCLPGCDLCLQNCRTGSISLPSRQQWQATLRRLRKEDHSHYTVDGTV